MMPHLPLHPHEHVIGSRDLATVQLILYGDYECPFTTRGMALVAGLVERVGDALLVTFRHFPLVDLHPHARAAAEAAEAADLQGRFWDLSIALFRHQRALDDRSLRSYAASLGLDARRFERDRASDEIRARVERDRASGEALGVDSTPTFFVNGTRYDGPVDGITALVEEALVETSSPGAG